MSVSPSPHIPHTVKQAIPQMKRGRRTSPLSTPSPANRRGFVSIGDLTTSRSTQEDRDSEPDEPYTDPEADGYDVVPEDIEEDLPDSPWTIEAVDSETSEWEEHVPNIQPQHHRLRAQPPLTYESDGEEILYPRDLGASISGASKSKNDLPIFSSYDAPEIPRAPERSLIPGNSHSMPPSSVFSQPTRTLRKRSSGEIEVDQSAPLASNRFGSTSFPKDKTKDRSSFSIHRGLNVSVPILGDGKGKVRRRDGVTLAINTMKSLSTLSDQKPDPSSTSSASSNVGDSRRSESRPGNTRNFSRLPPSRSSSSILQFLRNRVSREGQHYSPSSTNELEPVVSRESFRKGSRTLSVKTSGSPSSSPNLEASFPSVPPSPIFVQQLRKSLSKDQQISRLSPSFRGRWPPNQPTPPMYQSMLSTNERRSARGISSHNGDAKIHRAPPKPKIVRTRKHHRSSSAPAPLATRYGNGSSVHTSLYSASTPLSPCVRRGYWNRRGDHLTSDGYIVYAPSALAYPAELAAYPPEEEGYQNENGAFRTWAVRPELDESLPRKGRAPERPYESFVVYVDDDMRWSSVPHWSSIDPFPNGLTHLKPVTNRSSHRNITTTTTTKEPKGDSAYHLFSPFLRLDKLDLDARLAALSSRRPISPTSSSSSYGSAHSTHSRASSWSRSGSPGGYLSGHIPGTTRDVMEFPFGYPMPS